MMTLKDETPDMEQVGDERRRATEQGGCCAWLSGLSADAIVFGCDVS